MTYAVIWSENGGPVYAGGLELAVEWVVLAGTAPPALESGEKLFYEELADTWIERRPEARLRGLTTLVIERRNGTPLRIASVQGVGALVELVDRLAVARGRAALSQLANAR